MDQISRRTIIRGIAAASAGLSLPVAGLARVTTARPNAAGGGGMGGGGMGGGGMGGGGMGGTTVVDPPVGDPLRQPAVLANETTQAGVFEVSIEARPAAIGINGTTANLMTYNGLFPGPMIKVSRDHLLRLKFRNGLPDDGATNFLGHPTWVTNVHTHGLHVSPGDNANGTHSDNMMVMLDPGEATVYEYDLSRHPAGNLNFYHPHVHGCVADQMWAGLSGPLLIDDEVSTLAGYPQQVLVLKDITLVGSEPAPHASRMDYMHGLEGAVVMVNGQVNPRVEMAPGAVRRWRVVNACTARFFRLSLEQHAMYLVGTDGGLLDRPYPVTEVLLSPGERADILVKAGAAGTYRWLSLPYQRGGMSAQEQRTLLTLVSRGSTDNTPLPTVVDPAATRADVDLAALPRKQLSLTMGMGGGGMGGGMGGGGMGGVGINGITFVDHEHCFTTESRLDTWEIWEISNASGMDHPFHHHTNPAQVLSITGGDGGYASLYTTIPAWKDVTIVPNGGMVRLLLPVMDYTGMAMIHCHIIEHEDLGMMGVWDIMDGM